MRNRKEIYVPDFYRVYILLGICEFLLPNRIGRVFPIMFKLVNDIEGLGKAAKFDNEDTNECEESNMYDRMKHQPRLRLKSARIRTSFATNQRRKFRK